MSKYDSFQTTLMEAEPLVAALKALGYPVEIHGQPAPLFGYHGDERPERAHIIIRREYLDSASNDIGFFRGPDGHFRAILSEYDRSIGFDRRGSGAFISATRKSARWPWGGRKDTSSVAAK